MQLQSQEEYNYLVEECQAALVEGWKNWKEIQTRTMWNLGEIIFNHPVYKKHAKGNQEFVKRLARDIKGGSEMSLSDTTIYDCIGVYEKYSDVSTLLETLGNQPTWSRAVKLLRPPKEEEKKPQCRNCKIHCT